MKKVIDLEIANTKILQGVLFVVTCALVIAAKGSTTHALSASWTNSSGGNWSVGSNWSPGVVPNDSTDDATFALSGSTSAINVNNSFDIHDLRFTGFSTSSYDFIGSGQLNLYNSLIINSDDVSWNTHIVLQNDAIFNINQVASLNLAAINALSGTHGITLTGGGSIYNSGTATYSGTTTIEDGFFGSGDYYVWSPNSDFVLADNPGAILSACGGDQTIKSLSGGAASSVEFCGARITLGDSSDTTYAGTMQDTGNAGGGITKVGSGKFTLTGTNTYTGATIVDAGILDVNGSLTNSAVTVNSGGTLKGSGALKSVTMNGTVAPGNSIGTLNGDNFEFTNGSTLENEINPNGTTDLVNATSSVTIDAGANLKIIPQAGTYTAGQTYTIISAPSITGTFSTVTGTTNGLTYQLRYFPTHVDLVVSPANGASAATITSSGDVKAPDTGYGLPAKTSLSIMLMTVSVGLIALGLAVKKRI